MEPWQSWAIVLTGVGGAYWYYNHHSQPRSRTTRAQSVAEETPVTKQTKRREDSKAKRKSNAPTAERELKDTAPSAEATSSETGSGAGRAGKRKGGKKASKLATNLPVEAPSDDKADQAEDNDVEWAKQLASLKTGTNLKPPARSQSRNKTVRPGAAQISPDFSGTSSTTGADADDDLSPAMSPSLEASNTTAAPSGTDVSDMLEAPAPGPSVLRVTGSTQASRPRQPQQPKAAPEKETKKQRQNRRKAEERKLQRQEDEDARRVLMEKQRRTAREARGEPARNGMAAAPAPSSNAWTAPKPATGPNDASSNMSAPPDSNNNGLLDTFDDNASLTTDLSGSAPVRASGTTTDTSRKPPVVSEEEQMRILNEMVEEAGWSTVEKRRKGKKRATESSTSEVTGSESSEAGASRSAPAPTEKKGSTDKNPFVALENGGSNASLDPSPIVTNSHPGDSTWGVV